MRAMNREIWRLTWPNVVSNITVPILGMADTAIAGYVGGDVQIGAVSIGTAIFNFIYMNCSFLRMGTTGLTAQAYGGRREREAKLIMMRAVIVGLAISAILMMLKELIVSYGVDIMGGTEAVREIVREYVSVRIYAIPASVTLFAFNGWFIGMQDARTPMTLSIISNIINISASALFAIEMGMGIRGIALGTVVAQYSSLVMAASIYLLKYRPSIKEEIRGAIETKEVVRFFSINRDLMLRGFCIVTTYTMFTRLSADIGETELATNALLMQLFTLYSYMFDGVAYAAESLAGRFIGEGDKEKFRESCKKLAMWAIGISVAFVGAYAICGESILKIFSPSEDVMACASQNIGYILVVPLVGCIPYIIDGIMFGATKAAPLRNTMFVSTVLFLVMSYGLIPLIGNDGLWIAFIAFTAMRGILLARPMKKLYDSGE